MRMTDRQINKPIVDDEDELIRAVILHLAEERPEVVKAYPPGYFIMLLRTTVRTARDHFRLDDLAAIRLFTTLRWDIAAGYYWHPVIAETLLRTDLDPMARFERLLEPDLDQVWLEAAVHDGPDYWRGERRGPPGVPPETYEDEV